MLKPEAISTAYLASELEKGNIDQPDHDRIIRYRKECVFDVVLPQT